MKLRLNNSILLLAGVTLLLGLAATTYYYAMTRTARIQMDEQLMNSTPDFVAKNITITEFDANGSPDRRIMASHAEHYTTGRLDTIEPRYETLNPTTPHLEAQAQQGQTLDDGETYHFTGDVQVTRHPFESKPEMHFASDKATVFTDLEIVETDSDVILKNGQDVTHATGMHYDNVERTMELHSRVRSHFAPRP